MTTERISKGYFNNNAELLLMRSRKFVAHSMKYFHQFYSLSIVVNRLDLRVRNCDARFDVFPRETEDEKRCFELLQKAYIDARYKMDEYSITQEDLKYLADRVNQLKDLTEQICKEKLQSIGE